MTPIQNEVIQWCLERLHWPLICVGCWWIRGKVNEFTQKVDDTHIQVSNHIPTELKAQTTLLQNMDKNIAVMAAKKD